VNPLVNMSPKTRRRNRLLTLEDLTDDELETVKRTFERLAQAAPQADAAVHSTVCDVKRAIRAGGRRRERANRIVVCRREPVA